MGGGLNKGKAIMQGIKCRGWLDKGMGLPLSLWKKIGNQIMLR
jgi:hypothetical protein